jgi:hypothetical protein
LASLFSGRTSHTSMACRNWAVAVSSTR